MDTESQVPATTGGQGEIRENQPAPKGMEIGCEVDVSYLKRPNETEAHIRLAASVKGLSLGTLLNFLFTRRP
jgi:hypothetical protein